jgi:hypothetical protein
MYPSRILLPLTAIAAWAGTTLAGPIDVQVAERQTQKLRISEFILAARASFVSLNPLTRSSVPLGDSITEITCWRALVWDMLADAKYADQVQYVGSQNSNPQNCKPNTANWDEHHEGHSGWLAIDIANNYLTKWMQSTPADIVMFMLGTNDVVRGHTTADIMAAYTKMVNIMRAANPKMKIIVRPTAASHTRQTRASR